MYLLAYLLTYRCKDKNWTSLLSGDYTRSMTTEFLLFNGIHCCMNWLNLRDVDAENFG